MEIWRVALAIAQPETVIAWHRQVFKLFWVRKSQNGNKKSKPKVSIEIQKIIKKLSRENHTLGCSTHCEGIQIISSESTLLRYHNRSTKPSS